ncbi:MAG: hypothetical protein L6Q57_06005 [Alphaproteobacteria bacterium]|nr:hypothetical protein [Alphaproteobacteria bacterium]
MKKLFHLVAVTLVLVNPQLASASTDQIERLSVYEVNSFFKDMEKSLNSSDTHIGAFFLDRNVLETATFDENIQSRWLAPAYHDVWYGQSSYTAYARYPSIVSPYVRNVSVQSLSKHEKIGNFETLKRLIPGLQQTYTVTGVFMPAEATTAQVDLDLKAYGLQYVTYRPDLTDHVLLGQSACQAHLAKQNGVVLLTHMTCNTVSHLPL